MKHRYWFLSFFFLLFSLVITFVLVFIEQRMENLDGASILPPSIFLLLLLLLSIPLTIIIVYQLFKLIQERLKQNAGSRIRLHLTLFFVVITLISIGPQAFLSVNLVRIMLNTWYSTHYNRALSGALDITFNYYDNQVDTLQQLSTQLPLPFKNQDAQPLLASNQNLLSIKIINDKTIAAMDDGVLLLPQKDGSLDDLLYYKITQVDNGQTIPILLTLKLIDGFYQTSNLLESQQQSLMLYNRFAYALKSSLAFFYVLFGLPLGLLAILAGFLFSKQLIKPIISLKQATTRVAQGDYSVRLNHSENNELSSLMLAFNNMMDELEKARQQNAKIDKLMAWGDITRRMAHEVKNPLTPIKLAAQRIEKKSAEQSLDHATVSKAMRIIISEADGLSAMIDQFRSLSHQQNPTLCPKNLLMLVNKAVDLYRASYPLVNFEIDIASNIFIMADSSMMHQLFINLFKNSIEAMSSSGTISLNGQQIEQADQIIVKLTISDSGSGFAVDALPHLFTPYFSNKQGGIGLGLAVVQKIVFEHNGLITAHNNPQGGAVFILEFKNELKPT